MPREKHPIHAVAKKAGQLNKVSTAIIGEERPSRDARRSTSFLWEDLAKATSQLSRLAADESLNAAFVEKRHLLCVAQVGIRFVLHYGALTGPRQLRSVRGFGSDSTAPGLWVFLMTGAAASPRDANAICNRFFRLAVNLTPCAKASATTTSMNRLKSG